MTATIFIYIYIYIIYKVDDLDVPPECEESDRVNSRHFWTKIEEMHIAKGLIKGKHTTDFRKIFYNIY